MLELSREGDWMRRSAAMLGLVLVLGSVFVGDATAGAGKPRVYEGPLGDGATIFFQLVKRPDRPLAMRAVEFGIIEMTCDLDGSVQGWGVGIGWGGLLPQLPSHTIDMDMVEGDMALHLHGKIGAVQGAGTFSFAVPQFTQDQEAQTCGTGDLTWTVARTKPPVEQAPPPGTPIEVRHVVMPGGARVTLTRMT